MLVNLLFISPVFPDVEGSGPARRCHAVLTVLARRYCVTLVIVGRPLVESRSQLASDFLDGRWHYLPYVPSRRDRWLRGFERRLPRLYRKIFSWPVNWCEMGRSRRRAVAKLVDGRSFDQVHVYRLAMVPYALTIKAQLPAGTRFTLDIDDIDSICYRRIGELMHQNGDHGGAVEFDRAAEDFDRIERTKLSQFDRVYVCSEQDRVIIRTLHRDVRVLPNAVPAPDKPWQRPHYGPELRLLFVGLLGYYPNRDAVQWLCREILPCIRRDVPCRLWVGGRCRLLKLLALMAETEGVEYFGEFNTTDDGFGCGDVLLVPLRAGGGTRIKILEAMARGIPVISTTLGIEGIEAEPERDYLKADTVEEFAKAIARLWRDPELRERLSVNGRALWMERYSPSALENRYLMDL